MILETFTTVKVLEKYKRYKDQKEGYYNDDNGNGKVTGAALIIFLVIWLGLFVLWIISIVSAAKCPKPNIGEIVVAIFIWPLYWILKWTGAMCKGGK
jgi:hypothetical protein